MQYLHSSIVRYIFSPLLFTSFFAAKYVYSSFSYFPSRKAYTFVFLKHKKTRPWGAFFRVLNKVLLIGVLPEFQGEGINNTSPCICYCFNVCHTSNNFVTDSHNVCAICSGFVQLDLFLLYRIRLESIYTHF